MSEVQKSLAQKYRPSEFSDMIGQELTATVLQKLIDKNAVPHAMLFSGPSGTGKTTAARLVGMKLNPSQADQIAVGSSIDVVEIDAASNGGVADVRRLVDTLRYQASANATRVVIYDECHNITREGWNTLLKPTEEESGTVFVFVTTEPEKVPDTIISRLREYEFRRVSPYEIGTRLAQIVKIEDIQLDAKLLGHIAETSNGNVRGAIMTLDQVFQAGISTLEQYVELRGEIDQSPDLIRAMLTNNYAALSDELENQLSLTGNPQRITNDLVQCFSDLLVLRAGGSTDHTGKPQQDRKELAYLLEQERIIAAMKIVWDLKTRIRQSSNPASDVRLAITLISDVMNRGRSAPVASPQVIPPVENPVETPVEPAAPRKLSLSDMMRTKS